MTTTGTDLVRAALRARNFKHNLFGIARDVGASPQLLDEFTDGRANLPPEILSKVVAELWNGHAIYDAELDRLRSANVTPPKLMGVPPARYNPERHSPHHSPPAGAWSTGGIVGMPPSSQARPLVRPGLGMLIRSDAIVGRTCAVWMSASGGRADASCLQA